jgi:5-aminolevulinate synthase
LQPINFPAVARGQERLRITPTSVHTEMYMQALVDALLEPGTKLGWLSTRLAA